MTDFKVLGHRGAILPDAPFYQNSTAAFAEALTYGDGFETDACASSDGEIFLIHEAKYVHAETGVEYCVDEHLLPASQALLAGRKLEDMPAAEVRQLRLKDGSPLPALKDVLEQVGAQAGKILNIELKAHDVLAPVLRTLRNARLPSAQLMLSSFNHPSLLQARATLPDAAIGAIFVAADTAPAPLFPWHPQAGGHYCPLTAESLAQPLLQQVQPDYVVMPDLELNMSNIELIARYLPKARIFAWVFTERGGTPPDQMLQMVRTLSPTGKLAGVMVDNPRLYAAPLKQAAGAV